MENDNYESYGILYFSKGDKYEVEFKNDKFEGYGILYYLEGDRYGS